MGSPRLTFSEMQLPALLALFTATYVDILSVASHERTQPHRTPTFQFHGTLQNSPETRQIERNTAPILHPPSSSRAEHCEGQKWRL